MVRSDVEDKEPEHSGPVERPSLTLTSWENDLPVLSEVVICKFDGDEAYGENGQAKCPCFESL